jgi:DtxR family transcriptional regulator, Mn-dependent transcriptional regulator
VKTRTETDEYLEVVWYMRENGSSGIESFRREVGEHYSEKLVEELVRNGLIAFDRQADAVSLTEAGLVYTRQLIRSHRIAERLVHDVLGVPYEEGACEFEHIVNPDLVDSICTLLGHPRECPHGMPIPEGECCRQRAQSVESSIIPLSQLLVGESATIAYVNAKNDQQLHKLENLQLSPGNTVKLHQISPSFVIECENSMIAIDEQVASAINVWATSPRTIQPHGRRRRRGFRHGVGR